MGIFSNKVEMSRKIKEQESIIEGLKADKNNKIGEINRLNEKIRNLSRQNAEYENKYVNTHLECGFCYTTLQESFLFCPKCGKKIVRLTKTADVKTNKNLFIIENDMGYALITKYNGFSDKKIVIPSEINGKKVIGIWNNVFEKCTDLEEVFFEEGCQYIAKSVFGKCTNLKKVHLPKSLIEIGDSAFSGCSSLTEIAIPPKVTVIGIHAFSYCPNLKKILLPDGLQYISQGMLSNTGIEEIDIPKSVLHIAYSAFSNTKLTHVKLPENLYSINSYAFEIETLKQITIHSNVRIMAKDIFKSHSSPEILCSAGSKALLYARKYGLPCKEIPSSAPHNPQICASEISLGINIYGVRWQDETVENFRNLAHHINVPKAATWSWNRQSAQRFSIEKSMPKVDAKELAGKFYGVLAAPTEYGRKDVLGIMKEHPTILEHWGESVV